MPSELTMSRATTAEEVAAVTAVIALLTAPTAAAPATVDRTPAWVRASRLAAARGGLQRGPWRLSGRIGRRARA